MQLVRVELLGNKPRIVVNGRSRPTDTQESRLFVLLGIAENGLLTTKQLRQLLTPAGFEGVRTVLVDRKDNPLSSTIDKVAKHTWALDYSVVGTDVAEFERLWIVLAKGTDNQRILARRRIAEVFSSPIDARTIASHCGFNAKDCLPFLAERVDALNDKQSSVDTRYLKAMDKDLKSQSGDMHETGTTATEHRELSQLASCISKVRGISKVRSYLLRGKLEAASNYLESISTNDREELADAATLARAVIAYGRHDLELARRELEGLLAHKPHDVGALEILGFIYYYGEEYDKAVSLLKQAVSQRQTESLLTEKTAEATSNLASNLMQLKRYDEAEALYWQALAVYLETRATGPVGIYGILVNLANLRVIDKDYDAASQLYVRAKEYFDLIPSPDPIDHSILLNNMGVCLLRQGQHAKAKSLLSQALRLRMLSLPDGHRLIRETAGHLAHANHTLQEVGQTRSLPRATLAEIVDLS